MPEIRQCEVMPGCTNHTSNRCWQCGRPACDACTDGQALTCCYCVESDPAKYAAQVSHAAAQEVA